MANDTRREVELAVAVSTTGTQTIDDLTKRVRDLAKEGGAAAPEFDALATELGKLGAQNQAIEAVSKLTEEVDKASAAQAELGKRAATAKEGLQALALSSKEAADAEQRLRQAQLGLQDQLFEVEQNLRRLKAGLTDVEKGTSSYEAEVRRLTQDKLALKDAIRAQGRELDTAREQTKAAAAAEAEAAKAAGDTARAVERSGAALQQQQQALARAREGMEAAGLGTRDLAAAQTQLQQAIAKVSFDTQAAEAKRAAALEQAESDRLARVVEANRTKMLAAAQDQYQAERRAAAEAAQVVERYEAEKVAAAQRAAQQMSEAFSSVGVRSLEAIRAEALAVERAMQVMSESFRSGQISSDSLARGVAGARVRLQELTSEAAKVPAIKGAFQQLSEEIGGIVSRFGALGAGIAAVGFAVKPIVEANVQLDSMRRALTAVTGSSDEAQKQIDFLQRTAQRAGVAVGDIGESFVRFSASARASGIPMKVVQDVFEATALAAGNLGLSGDKVTHILDALAQMANKGVVSMEELRQQLGDSLPGALSLMAKGLGLTEQELVKLVESGQLLSQDALPALANALRQLGPAGEQVEGLSATFARMKSVVVEFWQTLGDGALFQGAMAIFAAFAGVIRDLSVAFVAVDQGIRGVAKLVGLLGAALTGQIPSFKAFKEELNAIWDEGSTKVGQYADKAYAGAEASKASATAATTAGNAVAQAGQQAQIAAAGHTANAQAQTAAGGAATANATAQTAAGAATAQAAQQAANASVSWAKLTSDYAQVATEIERQVTLAERLAAAKRIEGEASAAIATLSGNEREQLSASANAALKNADALESLAEKRRTEVAVLQVNKQALEDLNKEIGDPTGSRAKQIAELQKLIETRQAETERANASAEAARTEAVARSTTRATYEDNSKALDQLKASYENAANAADAFRRARELGAASDAQVTEAERAAAVAQKLYRDASLDTVAAVQRKIETLRVDAQVSQQALQVQYEAARASEAYYRSVGDETSAIREEVRQKEIQIEMIRQANAEKIKEADATIEANKRQLEDLAARNELTPEIEHEIELRIKNAQAKKLEAAAGEQTIKTIESETRALRDNASAQQAAAQAEGSRTAGKIGSDSNLKPDDSHIVGSYDLGALNTLLLKERAGQLGAGDLNLAEVAYRTALANSDVVRNAGNGFVSLNGYTSVEKDLREAQRVLDQVKGLTKNSAATATGGASPAGLGATGGGSTTVNINLGGKTRSITTDAAGASALQDLLRELEDGAGRSGP